eukprot:TRINITY_DN22849_c0_g1_i1.p1 TRINITY_DN22849_c0_g1~~TRINITY_DN22849_c0_g1_i1.p1  ORF type:complete len:404 (-),score=91.98 TRINITY_DN22849_c0_g1_i1:84-1295(-)
MGAANAKQIHELEAEYGMKIALRHWTKLKEYREYTDYSLQVSLSHWSDVGDLQRVQQLLKEIQKRASKQAEQNVSQALTADEDIKLSDEDVEKIRQSSIAQFNENLCRIPFQIAIAAGRFEVLEEFLFRYGLTVYPLEYMHPFVRHPLYYARDVKIMDFLETNGVDLYESPMTTHGTELQKAILHFAGDGIGEQLLLVHLLSRSVSIGPDTAMDLLTAALQLITRTFYSAYLEKLVYYGVDMKVEMDIHVKRLDKDQLARKFIKTYCDILEMEEPESSYDASLQTHMYKEKYPVIRRLFASGFLRSSFLRTRIEPLFQGENPPIELVIRAAMIGHKRIAQEMIDVKNTLLEIDIDENWLYLDSPYYGDDDYDDEKRIVVSSPSKHHLPRDVANVIVEFWFGYS